MDGAHSLPGPWAGRGRGRGSARPSGARRPRIDSAAASWVEVQRANGVPPPRPPSNPPPASCPASRVARSPILDAVLSTQARPRCCLERRLAGNQVRRWLERAASWCRRGTKSVIARARRRVGAVFRNQVRARSSEQRVGSAPRRTRASGTSDARSCHRRTCSRSHDRPSREESTASWVAEERRRRAPAFSRCPTQSPSRFPNQSGARRRCLIRARSDAHNCREPRAAPIDFGKREGLCASGREFCPTLCARLLATRRSKADAAAAERANVATNVSVDVHRSDEKLLIACARSEVPRRCAAANVPRRRREHRVQPIGERATRARRAVRVFTADRRTRRPPAAGGTPGPSERAGVRGPRSSSSRGGTGSDERLCRHP